MKAQASQSRNEAKKRLTKKKKEKGGGGGGGEERREERKGVEQKAKPKGRERTEKERQGTSTLPGFDVIQARDDDIEALVPMSARVRVGARRFKG